MASIISSSSKSLLFPIVLLRGGGRGFFGKGSLTSRIICCSNSSSASSPSSFYSTDASLKRDELEEGEKVSPSPTSSGSPNKNGSRISHKDPFGIEEELVGGEDKEKRSVVTGFYQREYGSENQESPNLKIYDEWIKSRESSKVRQQKMTGQESVRTTSFGEVRLDSDNLVEEEGQFDDPERHDPLKSQYYKKFQKEAEEEAESGKRGITAGEYLKQKKQEIVKAKKTQGPGLIEEPVTARRRKTKVEEEEEKFASLWDAEALDATHIPKIYQNPDYNKLTQTDMWSLLKHTLVFQNEWVLAINKPAGVPIHSPALDCRHHLIQFLDRFASDIGKCDRLYPLHRLDKETTGVLLFAKDERIAKYLKEKFARRQIDKTYLTITKGCPNMEEGVIKIPIGESKVADTGKYRSVLKPDLRQYGVPSKQRRCKEAITSFKVLSSTKDCAFLQVKIETGLKHQIRLHLGLGLGCPIIGDHKYSHRDRFAPQRLHPHLLHLIKVRQSKVRELPLHLHCSSISFTLPEGASDSVEPVYAHAIAPKYFKHTLKAFGLKN